MNFCFCKTDSLSSFIHSVREKNFSLKGEKSSQNRVLDSSHGNHDLFSTSPFALKFDLACALHLVIQGIMAILVSNKLNFGGVGPLAAITASAAAVIVWKKQEKTSDPDSVAQSKTCNSVLGSLWLIFEVTKTSRQ